MNRPTHFGYLFVRLRSLQNGRRRASLRRFLGGDAYDCVVIGAGVRLPRTGLVLFEAVVNAGHRMAPQAAIAFNMRPEDSSEAAARWI